MGIEIPIAKLARQAVNRGMRQKRFVRLIEEKAQSVGKDPSTELRVQAREEWIKAYMAKFSEGDDGSS